MKKFIALSVFLMLVQPALGQDVPLRVEQQTYSKSRLTNLTQSLRTMKFTELTLQAATKSITVNKIVVNEGNCVVPEIAPRTLKYGEKITHTFIASYCSILKVEVYTDLGDFGFTW